MDVQLKDQVAWITGGGEGIGRAIALLAAEAGAKVAITGRDIEPLEDVVAEIEKQNGTALSVPGDVTVPEEMQQAVKSIIDEWGQIDFLCANAGTNGTWSPIEELDYEEWTKTISVNLTGTYLAIHHTVPHMKAAGRGSIVILSSVNGTRIFSNEGASAYAASKAGQLALGQMLALELAPSKIRVNIICPGAIDTGIHKKTERRDLEEIDNPVEFPEGNIPLTGGDMGKARQVAQLAIFLASDVASHITGTPVWIDGAESLLQG
ncbi:SDR family NAD(P)-dependent oxidoreductase [uncultured Rubinisphaera sp.]|uniref:SDR family oxidoreductase n=1 Tax=uncultured Rubinisphaera sp. TaxID=1678686 RepID=UPI0030D81D09